MFALINALVAIASLSCFFLIAAALTIVVAVKGILDLLGSAAGAGLDHFCDVAVELLLGFLIFKFLDSPLTLNARARQRADFGSSSNGLVRAVHFLVVTLIFIAITGDSSVVVVARVAVIVIISE